MSIHYPKSPSERHLREHTHTLLSWSAVVMAVVGLLGLVCGSYSRPRLAADTLGVTTGVMPMPQASETRVRHKSFLTCSDERIECCPQAYRGMGSGPGSGGPQGCVVIGSPTRRAWNLERFSALTGRRILLAFARSGPDAYHRG